jgi:hypothetical protein
MKPLNRKKPIAWQRVSNGITRPEHGSWLNIAECELSVLQRQCLDRPIPDMSTLKREVSAKSVVIKRVVR